MEDKNKVNKWASFTYAVTEVLSVTKLLKKHNIIIAYKTDSTVAKYLSNMKNDGSNLDAYDKIEIYKLKMRQLSRWLYRAYL
jgi:hypothetical protein